MGPCAPPPAMLDAWAGRRVLTTCLEVDAVGATGAGDCTIAGFLAGLLRGLTLEATIQAAVGVGACNVKRADVTSGVPSWDLLVQRIGAGWRKRPPAAELRGWIADRDGLWHKPG